MIGQVTEIKHNPTAPINRTISDKIITCAAELEFGDISCLWNKILSAITIPVFLLSKRKEYLKGRKKNAGPCATIQKSKTSQVAYLEIDSDQNFNVSSHLSFEAKREDSRESNWRGWLSVVGGLGDLARCLDQWLFILGTREQGLTLRFVESFAMAKCRGQV